jgi:Mg2+-importing ATPase
MLRLAGGSPSRPASERAEDTYWTLPPEAAAAALGSAPRGLSSEEARVRLERDGANALRARPTLSQARLFLRQFENPLILILVFAAVVAAVVRDWTDAAIVLAILLGSGVLGFLQERRASAELEKLRARIRIVTMALRDGAPRATPSEQLVAGDVVLLSAGSLVPADGLVLESKDFFVIQAALTGEPVAVEKQPGTSPADASLAERENCVFMGTSVRSGTARVLVARTGTRTVYGALADRLRLRPPETEFERGVRRFGLLLTQVMLILVIVIFGANMLLERPPVEALLFAVALAVGMSPELLPAIVTITLSQGAHAMAGRGVIVRRLGSIENLGSMDVLCTDKTGTLTVGVMDLDAALGPDGAPSEETLRLAYLNAACQTGLANPLDDAIVARCTKAGQSLAGVEKLDEVPYDFVRKRLSVVVREPGQAQARLIVKGAYDSVLSACSEMRGAAGPEPLSPAAVAALQASFARWSAEGFRVLGIASKPVVAGGVFGREAEQGLAFDGFLLFRDPLKPGIRDAVARLTGAGVALKIITGDNRLVAAHLAGELGVAEPKILTGRELNVLSDEALGPRAEATDLFAEVDPNQKERIILALKRAGRVVGYLGDGINDASALHAADVGVSVDQAVDVAKDAADLVLLRQDLTVLADGVALGRKTFANTLKYISITTSANFGNMISMAVASFFLPFLPLLATQILLNNFLSDLPALAVSSDSVDPESVARPHRWSVRAIRDAMLTYGLVSSIFDMITFGALLALFHAAPDEFRTAWFVESLLTELLIVFVIRTRRPFWRSRPGEPLMWATAAVIPVALALPYSPIGGFFSFTPLPPAVMGAVLLIAALYVAASEVAKQLRFGRARVRA